MSYNWVSIITPFLNKRFTLNTKLKGLKGRSNYNGILVRQRRALNNNFFIDTLSKKTFKTKPSISIEIFNTNSNPGSNILFISADGLLFFNSSTRFSLFDFFLWDFKKILPKTIKTISVNWLIFFKLGSKLKNICQSLRPNITYSKSFGSKSVLTSYDEWSGEFLIKLPSGSMKLFFLSSVASQFNQLEDSATSNPKVFLKAGESQLRGKKSKVRGVAMNPVDHPHGGRAKSIRFQRTPWGLRTK